MPVDGFEAERQELLWQVSELQQARDRLDIALQKTEVQLAEQGEKLKAAEDLNVFFRNSVGECHVMISRNASEYQIQKQWDATELPARLQKLMKAAEAERDGLKARIERMTEVQDNMLGALAAYEDQAQALEQRISGAKVCSHIYTRVALTSTTNCPACTRGIVWPEPAESKGVNE